MPDRLQNLISVAEAARRLGVTRARVNQLIYAGRLAAQKIGRNYVIDSRDLEALRTRKVGRPSRSD